MNTGKWSIRAKIVALVAVPLAALVALWIFTTVLTIGPALDLLATRALHDEVRRPGETVVAELQNERRLSLVYLAGRADLPALSEQRSRTDAAVEAFRSASSGDLRDTADGRLDVQLDQLYTSLEMLPTGRGFVDRREVDQAGALGLYSGMIEGAFRVFDTIADIDDDELNREARAITALGRAREVLGQSDALLAGAFAAGRFGAGEHAQLVQIIGAHRYLYAAALPALPDTERVEYQRLNEGEAFTQLRSLEDRIIAQGRDGQAVPVTAPSWQSAYEPVIRQLRVFESATSDALADRAGPVAVGVLLRLALAGLLGLAAIVLSLLISLRVGRSLIRRLTGLRENAMDLADQRLPALVDRLRRGDEVDVAAEAPPLEYGADEIGQLGRAFTEAQRTAVQAAVDEATVRQGLNDVFLNIARRSQALLHRQLDLLDKMERRSTDPDELEDLFRIDHLATRMRRHAEDLVILAGAAPGRGWRNPITVVDVVRGAVSEVEDYARVSVAKMESVAIAGRAVGDMIHLLAELIENATSYSPPDTRVQVTGQNVPNGYAIEIEDRGLGMTAEALADANRRLARPPDFDPANSAQLGLFVVAQLGARHEVRIQLRDSPYGGVTAVVLVPPELVVEVAELPTEEAPVDGSRRVRRVRALSRAPQGALEPLPRRSLEAAPRPVLVPVRAEPATDEAGAAPGPAAGNGAVGTDGLPRRVRQASLAPQLRTESADATTADDEPTPRSPEQARAAMLALQSGTARGRRDADLATSPEPVPPRGGPIRATASPPAGAVVSPPAAPSAAGPSAIRPDTVAEEDER